MRAVVAPRYGDAEVLEVRERAVPAPGPHDLLVRVRAAGVNPADLHLLRGQPAFLRLMGHGLRRPRYDVPGADVAGRVEEVGAAVRAFEPGDEVFADLSAVGRGAFAEYVVAPAAAWARKPCPLDAAAAAAVPMAAVTALQGLRDHGRLAAGQRVLVHGASGGVGTFAVQIAKTLGAHVTGVSSGRNTDLVASLGADRTVDYTREDFTAGHEAYDLIFDTVGNRSIREVRAVLAPEGTYVSTAFSPGLLLAGLGRRSQRLHAMVARPNATDLRTVGAWLEEGAVAPVLDRTYPLERARDALAYLEGRRARGKVVLVA